TQIILLSINGRSQEIYLYDLSAEGISRQFCLEAGTVHRHITSLSTDSTLFTSRQALSIFSASAGSNLRTCRVEVTILQ
ncbi:hypothetical protein BaRGS_00020912, partial [Batillaria attramentaria]